MMEIPAWCEFHWGAVLKSLGGESPINGLMATEVLMQRWLDQKSVELGEEMPGAQDAEAMNVMAICDAPLCCYFGDEVLSSILDQCVLPEQYRGLPVPEGHVRHMQDERDQRPERETFQELYASRYMVEGDGPSAQVHAPCPFCAEADFLTYPLVDVMQALTAGDVRCRSCERTVRFQVKEDAEVGLVIEMFQVAGAPPPPWMHAPPRRVTS